MIRQSGSGTWSRCNCGSTPDPSTDWGCRENDLGDRLSPDGSRLASGGYSVKGIRLHDFKTEELKTLLRGHEDTVVDLAFSPNGQWLASASADNTVRIWSIGPSQANVETSFVL